MPGRRNYRLIPLILLASAVGCGGKPDATARAIGNGHGLVCLGELRQRQQGVLLSEASRKGFAEGDYTFENRTDQPATLTLDSKSCGCVDVRSVSPDRSAQIGEPIVVAPGTRTTLRLRVRLAIRAETQSQTVTFTANSVRDQGRSLALRLDVPVIDDASIVPPAVTTNVTNVAERERLEVLTVVRYSRERPRSDARFSFGHQSKRLRLSSTTPPKTEESEPGLWRQTFRATMAVDLRDLDANEFETIRVAIDGLDGEGLSLPVSLVRKCGVKLSSGSLDFGSVELGKVSTRKILMYSADEREFGIDSTARPGEQFRADARTGPPMKRHIMEVQFEPKARGDFKDDVVIKTDHPEAPTLVVCCRGTCR